MNKLIKANILATCMLLGLNVFAGDIAGNGGDIITCTGPDGNRESSKLLDYYELENLQGKTLDLGSDDLTYMEKVNYALDKLEALSYYRAYSYRKELEVFFDRTLFINGPIPEMEDEGELSLPENCILEQAAVQLSGENEPFHKYLIRQAAWDAMDDNSKAGLILHEIIFDEVSNTNVGAGNGSVHVRRLNWLISSGEIEGLTQGEIITFYIDNYFQTATYDGMNIILYPMYGDKVSAINSAITYVHKEHLSQIRVLLHKDESVTFNSITFYCPAGSCKVNVNFHYEYASNRIRSLELFTHGDDNNAETSGHVFSNGVDTKVGDKFQYIIFYENGGLRSFALIKPGPVRVFSQDGNEYCIVPKLEYVDENGYYYNYSYVETRLFFNSSTGEAEPWNVNNNYNKVPIFLCN